MRVFARSIVTPIPCIDRALASSQTNGRFAGVARRAGFARQQIVSRRNETTNKQRPLVNSFHLIEPPHINMTGAHRAPLAGCHRGRAPAIVARVGGAWRARPANTLKAAPSRARVSPRASSRLAPSRMLGLDAWPLGSGTCPRRRVICASANLRPLRSSSHRSVE